VIASGCIAAGVVRANRFMRAGYERGLSSIKIALTQMEATGIRDVDYWRDSVRWLGKASNAVNERNFCLAAVQLMFHAHLQLQDSIRLDVIRAASNIGMAESDIDVLEKVLWILAEVVPTEGCGESILLKFLSSVSLKVVAVGELSSIRSEIIPSLLRLSAKVDIESFHSIVDLVLRKVNAPGKALWTLADILPDLVKSPCSETIFTDKLCVRLGQVLLLTPSIKAKMHLARACRKILTSPDCSETVRATLMENMRTCESWLDRAEAPVDLPAGLYRKYRHALQAELEEALHH
jgi:hypothetical protein